MDKIEQKIVDLIEQHKDEIITIGRDIWKEPELGYKEYQTSGKFCRYLEKFGIEAETGLAITGAKGYLKGAGAPGPTVALIGEMDALPMADSPYAGHETGEMCIRDSAGCWRLPGFWLPIRSWYSWMSRWPV